MSGCFHRRSITTATVLLVFLLGATCLLAARCVVVDGARSRYYYGSGRPAPAVRLYGGYLPRPKVIPPSGPSEGHNSIGPETVDRLRRKP